MKFGVFLNAGDVVSKEEQAENKITQIEHKALFNI